MLKAFFMNKSFPNSTPASIAMVFEVHISLPLTLSPPTVTDANPFEAPPNVWVTISLFYAQRLTLPPPSRSVFPTCSLYNLSLLSPHNQCIPPLPHNLSVANLIYDASPFLSSCCKYVWKMHTSLPTLFQKSVWIACLMYMHDWKFLGINQIAPSLNLNLTFALTQI